MGGRGGLLVGRGGRRRERCDVGADIHIAQCPPEGRSGIDRRSGGSRGVIHPKKLLNCSFPSHPHPKQQPQELELERKRLEACQDRQSKAYFDVRSKEKKIQAEVEEVEVCFGEG